MSLSVILGALWVFAATITALLPMRLQYAPGLTLLILAPALIIFLGIEHGVWLAVLGLLAFVSMFRHPLRYLWRRARGVLPEMPK